MHTCYGPARWGSVSDVWVKKKIIENELLLVMFQS